MLCSHKIVTGTILSRPKVVGYKVAAENRKHIAVALKVRGHPCCGMDRVFRQPPAYLSKTLVPLIRVF